MGNKLIIKQINKAYNSKKAIENVLHYIVREKDSIGNGKVCCWKAFGASGTNIQKVCRQFIKIQKIAGKDNQKRIRHIMISFPAYVNNVRKVEIAADAIASFIFKDYQVAYAIHEKKNAFHIHLAINPVSYRTLKKWHMSWKEFEEWRKEILKVVNKSIQYNGNGMFNVFDL